MKSHNMTYAGAKKKKYFSELECRVLWCTLCLSGATGGNTEQAEFQSCPRSCQRKSSQQTRWSSLKPHFQRASSQLFATVFWPNSISLKSLKTVVIHSSFIGMYVQKVTAILTRSQQSYSAKTHYQSLMLKMLTPHKHTSASIFTVESTHSGTLRSPSPQLTWTWVRTKPLIKSNLNSSEMSKCQFPIYLMSIPHVSARGSLLRSPPCSQCWNLPPTYIPKSIMWALIAKVLSTGVFWSCPYHYTLICSRGSA